MVTQTVKISLLLNNQLFQYRAYKIYCLLKVSLRMHLVYQHKHNDKTHKNAGIKVTIGKYFYSWNEWKIL